MHNPYIVGKLIYLRHPTEEDVNGPWYEWFSDEETTKYMGERYWPNSKEAQFEFYKSIQSNRTRLVLSIVDIQTNKHIGVSNLSSINWVHRFCEMAVVIGEKEFRKGTIAYECFHLLLKIAFLRLNLRHVKADYVKSNEFTKQIIKVLKFQEIGEVKNFYWADGKYRDYVLGILNRDAWLKRNGYYGEE